MTKLSSKVIDAKKHVSEGKFDIPGTNTNTPSGQDSNDGKNWWTGEGFSTDHWLAHTDANDPKSTALGAGTIFGGKDGGGIGGLIGTTLRAIGGGGQAYTRNPDTASLRNETKESKETSEDGQETFQEESNQLAGVENTDESAYQNDFQLTFNNAREQREKTFNWINQEGTINQYSTRLEGESEEEWMNFLNNTTSEASIADNITDSPSNDAFGGGGSYFKYEQAEKLA